MDDKLRDHEIRLRECEKWRATRDGQDPQLWAAQHRWNGKIEASYDSLEERVLAMETEPRDSSSVLSKKQAAAATTGISGLTLLGYKMLEWIGNILNNSG